eukprot:1155620-Pelagomonas_calceolata.AAC.5
MLTFIEVFKQEPSTGATAAEALSKKLHRPCGEFRRVGVEGGVFLAQAAIWTDDSMHLTSPPSLCIRGHGQAALALF